MHCLAVWEQDDTEKLTFVSNLLPLPDSSVCLDFNVIGIFDRVLDPFNSNSSTIRSLPHVHEIRREFHITLV